VRDLFSKYVRNIVYYTSTERCMRNLSSFVKASDKPKRLLLKELCVCIWILWSRIQSK